MKPHTLKAPLPRPDDNQSRAPNLRHPYPGASLSPVSPPSRLCSDTGIPLASWTGADGSATYLFQSPSLMLRAISADGGDPVTIGPLPAIASTAIVTPTGVLIFTPSGTYIASTAPDGSWKLSAANADFPAIALIPSDPRTHTAGTPALTLQGNYTSWSGALLKADIDMLGNAALSALRSASQAAVADGCAATPILAWYRLRDAAGRILFRSTPAVVTPAGIQGAPSVEMTVGVSGGAYRAVSPVTVSITGFRIGMRCNLDAITDAHRAAATLELLVAPPLDLVDYDGTPYITRLTHTATDGRLRIDIPRLTRHATILPALLDRLDELSTVAAVIPDPFAPDSPLASGSVHTPELNTDLSSAAAQASILKALARAPRNVTLPEIIRETSLPHTFNAAVATVAGDITAMADITPVHALPMAPSAMWTTGTAYGPWHAKICVSLLNADGATERLCAEETGEGPLPVAIMPMLSYPHPGAFRMDIEIITATDIVSRSFPLTPTPAALAACWVSPSLKPVEFSSFTATVSPMRAVTVRRPVRRASAMLVADVSSPATPCAATTIGGGAVTALTEASRANAGLAFGRRHLYAFTTAGVHTVSVGTAGRLAVSLISPGAVSSPGAVAVGTDAVYAATSTGVMRLNGTRADIIHPSRFAAIGYSPLMREIWCLPPSGAPRRWPMIIDRTQGVYSRTDILPDAFSHIPGTLLITTPDGIYDASHEEPDITGKISVAWSRRICLVADMVPRVHALSALMSASEADIAIDLLGDNGDTQPHRFAGLAMTGKIAAPPYLPVIAHPHRYVTLSLSGSVSPDATLTSFRLVTSPSPFLF